jgi:glycosyltransferase involved in cell wall biosynthesis
MHILLFNLATDADDPVLGFTTGWIRTLADRVEFIDVITMRAGRLQVPSNVRIHSVGKERGYSEPRRVVEFYRVLRRILRAHPIDVCFSHMMPLFTVLAGPVLKAKRIPIVTWYAHPKLTWVLRLAHGLSNRMVASVSTAYPYRHDKFISIGQGIDTNLFTVDKVLPDEPPMILCVGRLSPIKDHPTLITAVRLLKHDWAQPFRVVVLGGPATARDESYTLSLFQQVKQLGLAATISFEPPITMETLPSWYRRCTVVVNMTPTGSGDKVVWEAMACGRPSVVANEGFRETLGAYADRLLFTYGKPEELSQRLRWILGRSNIERESMGDYLRKQVAETHSLERLAERLASIFAIAAR